jgi:hypothetical protein
MIFEWLIGFKPGFNPCVAKARMKMDGFGRGGETSSGRELGRPVI